jgi:hypothetical protein
MPTKNHGSQLATACNEQVLKQAGLAINSEHLTSALEKIIKKVLE